MEPFRICTTGYRKWELAYGHGISLSKDFVFTPEELIYSNKIYVYSLKGEEISVLKVKGNVIDLVATPDGKYLVVSDDALRIYMFEINVIELPNFG